jgi:hypothetical protein
MAGCFLASGWDQAKREISGHVQEGGERYVYWTGIVGSRSYKLCGLIYCGTDCCAMMIEFHRRGLMQKEVLDDDMDVVSELRVESRCYSCSFWADPTFS